VADDLRVTDRLTIPAVELRERFSRSSGPGGQGVNTADSRVELSFDLASSPSVPDDLRQRALGRLAGRLSHGTITVAASEHRAQLANREAARLRLAALLRAAIEAPPPVRAETAPPGPQHRLTLRRRARGPSPARRPCQGGAEVQ
jgi:ribosome-associated protein